MGGCYVCALFRNVANRHANRSVTMDKNAGNYLENSDIFWDICLLAYLSKDVMLYLQYTITDNILT